MRLLMSSLGRERALAIARALDDSDIIWDVDCVMTGGRMAAALASERYDIVLLHAFLPEIDGLSILRWLWENPPVCPPRVIIMTEPEIPGDAGELADCAVPIMSEPTRVARLLETLCMCKMPMLAQATSMLRGEMIRRVMRELALSERLKGHAYIAWLLDVLVPNPLIRSENMAKLYPECARCFATSAACVERCVRHAIENVFTTGSMQAADDLFGMTIDPERGKLTNRAFLLSTSEQIRMRMERYSRASTRSRNRSDMHHSPAAPTSV